MDRLRQAFLESRFAGVVPRYTERAFLLSLDGSVVGGRIDAIFGEDDGPWEVVDWKTGRRPQADDPLASLQLDIYGLACVEIWGRRPEDLTLTYLYLASGEEVSHPMGDPAEVRARVGGVARRDRARRVRAHAGTAVPVLRLPLVLRRGHGVARGRSELRGYAAPSVSRSTDSSNVRYCAAGS